MGSSASMAFTRRARATAPGRAPVLKHIDDAMTRFEAMVTRVLDSAAHTLGVIGNDPGAFADFALEKVLARSIEWTENAANDNRYAQAEREAA